MKRKNKPNSRFYGFFNFVIWIINIFMNFFFFVEFRVNIGNENMYQNF